jgi:acetyl-CoA synthetase
VIEVIGEGFLDFDLEAGMSDITSDELRMIKESGLYYPNPEKVRETHHSSADAFNALLRKSQDDPETFWAEVADELHWIKRWEKVKEGDFPHFKFFVGGISNPCYNILDRHLDNGGDNKLALIWEGENGETKFFSYRMLYCEVNKFANVLRRFGLKKGEAIAIFLPNLAEAVIAVLACYRLGVIFNTVFSGFSARAVRDRLINYEPKLVVTADAGYRRGVQLPLKEKIDEAIEGIDSVQTVIVVDRANVQVNMQPGRDWWWNELMATAPLECPPEPMEANEPSLVFYTSGTTGKPKGVVHAGMAFVVNNYVYAKYHMNHHPSDMFWCTADIGWLTMHIWGIVGALVNGATTIFYEGAVDYPRPDRFYQIVHKYRVNKLFTTPTLIRMLMRHGEKLMEPYDRSCLDVISLVGEPFNPEAWHWTYEKLGEGRVYVNNTWGQTELAGCPLAGAAWITPMKPGSCGVQFLGADVDVVDQQGTSLPPYVPGNLIIRKPFPMMARDLWKEPERFVREYFSQVDGCYFTNDAAIKDPDGHFWVMGRLDDVINVAGHRLSTMEIESAIMESEGVAEAAVIGAPDELKGLVPVAFVTLRVGYVASPEMEERIKQYVAGRISKITVPSHVLFTEVMPKTPSGKIMRRLLKEIFLNGDIRGDITGLEDISDVERIKEVVRARLTQ